MSKKTKGKKIEITTKKTLVGVGLVFIGVMFLARNLGLIPDELTNYWPVILVILGLWSISGGLEK